MQTRMSWSPYTLVLLLLLLILFFHIALYSLLRTESRPDSHQQCFIKGIFSFRLSGKKNLMVVEIFIFFNVSEQKHLFICLRAMVSISFLGNSCSYLFIHLFVSENYKAKRTPSSIWWMDDAYMNPTHTTIRNKRNYQLTMLIVRKETLVVQKLQQASCRQRQKGK